jgi:two-component system CheB/CheR fusion protein
VSDRILVVEDDRDSRDLLATVVELSGRTAELVSNGRQALAKLRAGPVPCLVIADLMMPEMDGRELRRHMLADPRLASVPYIVVSGVADLADEVQTLCVAVALKKPLDVEELLQQIETHC